MAEFLLEKYGPQTGTSASKFQSYIALRATQKDPTRGVYVQMQRYLLFTPGEGYGGKDGFSGSTFWCNWGGDFKVYGNGTGDGSQKIYGNSGWVDVGWVAPGSTTVQTAQCGYTSNSMGELSSTATVSYTAEVTASAPSAPVITSPIQGAAVDVSSALGLLVEWEHVPTDGSAQTAAEIKWSNGGDSETVSVNGEIKSYVFDGSKFSEGELVLMVRTAGASGEFGPWSGGRMVRMATRPKAAIYSPADGSTVSSLPISVAFDYVDKSGTLANATLTLTRDGAEVFSKGIGTALSADISAEEYVPANGAEYGLRIDVRSSTGLESYGSSSFMVAYTPPKAPTVAVEPVPERGTAIVTVGEADGEGEPIAHVNVYRVREGGAKELAAYNLAVGASFEDARAPLNVGYSYEAHGISANGAVSTAVVSTAIPTRHFFFIGHVTAKGELDPEGSATFGRPGKRRVSFSKRELPVSFDAPNYSDERTVSLLLRTKEEAEAFEALMRSGGRCVYKSGDGDVLDADVDVSLSQSFSHRTRYGTVTVSIHRIDGRA